MENKALSDEMKKCVNELLASTNRPNAKRTLKDMMIMDFMELTNSFHNNMKARIHGTTSLEMIIAIYNNLLCMEHEAYEIIDAYEMGLTGKATKALQEFIERYGDETMYNPPKMVKKSKEIRWTHEYESLANTVVAAVEQSISLKKDKEMGIEAEPIPAIPNYNPQIQLGASPHAIEKYLKWERKVKLLCSQLVTVNDLINSK